MVSSSQIFLQKFVCISNISDALLDTFAELWREAYFRLACPSACTQLTSTGQIFFRFCVWYLHCFFDHNHVWLKLDKSNSSGRHVCVYCFPSWMALYNSDTSFCARYAKEALFVIEAVLCEVRTGGEETGEHRALRTIDCKRRMSIFNTLRTGSFKLFQRSLPGFFLTILTL